MEAVLATDSQEFPKATYNSASVQQPRAAPNSQVAYPEVPQQSKQSDVYKTQAPYHEMPQQFGQQDSASLWGPPSAPEQQGLLECLDLS